VAIAAPADLLLFVSGEPGPEENLSRDVMSSIGARIAGTVISSAALRRGGGAAPPTRSPADSADVWHVPRAEVSTVNLVIELARKAGREVTLVNVNGRGDQSLSQRWVSVQDVLPVLVRPDGERLVGLEQFGPGSLQRFLQAGTLRGRYDVRT